MYTCILGITSTTMQRRTLTQLATVNERTMTRKTGGVTGKITITTSPKVLKPSPLLVY